MGFKGGDPRRSGIIPFKFAKLYNFFLNSFGQNLKKNVKYDFLVIPFLIFIDPMIIVVGIGGVRKIMENTF